MRGNPLHRLKFALWNFARCNPVIGRPIRYAGGLSMAGAAARYRALMAREIDSILPADAYERPLDVPTQAWLAIDGASPESLRGIGLLLNHLRVPYRKAPMAVVREAGDDAGLILAPGIPARHAIVPDGGLVITFSGDEKRPGLATIEGGAERLLPDHDGLRSEFTASVLSALHSGLRRPLVTGMLPAGVGLRLDDIKGQGAADWLPPILEQGWRPNLGLFLDAFAAGDNPHAPWLARLAQAGAVEISPHAFAEDRLLFFDLPWHRSYSISEAEAQWARAESIMARNHFPISPVINAHFHVVCPIMATFLSTRGMRYLYSEYELGSHRIRPDSAYWPSGDPIHSTGRLYPFGILQIAAGDSMGELMNPFSHYDFMMHIDRCDTAGAAGRAVHRLRLSLACGFPAYLTTHEPMLCGVQDRAGHADLWQRIESGLRGLGAPPKVGLETLGAQCRDHRATSIWSVSCRADGHFEVEMRGQGDGALRVLGPGERLVGLKPFAGAASFVF